MVESMRWKSYELPIYHNGRMSEVMEFRTAQERDDYRTSHPLTNGWSYDRK